MASLQPLLRLLDLAAGMVRIVLLRPTERVGALKVGFAELTAVALAHTLHAKWDRAVAIHIIHTSKTELIGRAATCFDGHRASKGHEI